MKDWTIPIVAGAVLLILIMFFFRWYRTKERREAEEHARRVQAGREALGKALGDIVPARDSGKHHAHGQHERRPRKSRYCVRCGMVLRRRLSGQNQRSFVLLVDPII